MTPPDNPVRRLLRAGYTEKAIAEYLGVTQPAVSQWKTGKRGIPGPVRVLLEMLLEKEEREEGE